MKDLQTIGVLAHPFRPSTAPLAEKIEASLRRHNLNIWMKTAWTPENIQEQVAESDMVVAIGGDGAMLRAARLCAPFKVPVFGINAGKLGFLTEGSPDEWDSIEKRLLSGDYWLEHRMMVSCEVWDNGSQTCKRTEDALNDVVIGRGAIARSIYLDTHINNIWTTTYNADGLIIATSTGSTAYALAVGGPLMPPKLRNLLVVPVAPHLSMDRAILVAGEDIIKVVVAPRSFDPEVVVTLDGEMIASLDANDYIIVKASDKVSSFVRMRERGYFFRSILDRLEPRLAQRHPAEENQS